MQFFICTVNFWFGLWLFGSIWRANMQNYLNISFNHMCHTLNIQIRTVQLLHLQTLRRSCKVCSVIVICNVFCFSFAFRIYFDLGQFYKYANYCWLYINDCFCLCYFNFDFWLFFFLQEHHQISKKFRRACKHIYRFYPLQILLWILNMPPDVYVTLSVRFYRIVADWKLLVLMKWCRSFDTLQRKSRLWLNENHSKLENL